METFWKTIALYNSTTWFIQLAIIIVGILLTFRLAYRPGRWSTIGMKLYLIFLYLWIAIAYFYVCCAERSYHDIMTIFWCVLSASWIWDLIKGYTDFKRNTKYTGLASFLLFIPFLYPIASLLRGLTFPQITSPVMPCSVVVFTIGLMLMYARKINLFIILLLCHWSMIGLTKTYFFNIPEDYLLASAAVPAIYLFFKGYFLNNLHKSTKPKTKYMNWLLIALCICIGMVLMYTLFMQLGKDI